MKKKLNIIDWWNSFWTIDIKTHAVRLLDFKEKVLYCNPGTKSKVVDQGNDKVNHRNLRSYIKTKIEMHKYPQCSEINMFLK